MLKLTLTTNDAGPALEAHLSLIAQTLGIAVEAVGLDGYTVALVSHEHTSLAFPVPVIEVPTPNFAQFQPIAPPAEG